MTDYLTRRAQTTLGTERAKTLQLVPADTMPLPGELVSEQIEGAIARAATDFSEAPRWPWKALDGMAGPMLPGDFVVVGALTGGGKTSFLMSAMDQWAARKTATLYIPLEIDPALCRLRWAAWKLGVNPVHVFRSEWDALPPGTEDAIRAALRAQRASGQIYFAPPSRITLAGITKWTRWAVTEVGAKQIILDHLSRVDHGEPGDNHRLAVSETVRALKDLARELGIVVIAATQLNRSSDVLDAYLPPHLPRIKESSGVAEEADSVLMLSRKLQRNIEPEVMRDIKAGLREASTRAEPNVMAVTCRKHRLDDSARDSQVYLAVQNGRVVDEPHRAFGARPDYPDRD